MCIKNQVFNSHSPTSLDKQNYATSSMLEKWMASSHHILSIRSLWIIVCAQHLCCLHWNRVFPPRWLHKCKVEVKLELNKSEDSLWVNVLTSAEKKNCLNLYMLAIVHTLCSLNWSLLSTLLYSVSDCVVKTKKKNWHKR